eukprot:1159735-Pelagomonas_calceolata.AAC.9
MPLGGRAKNENAPGPKLAIRCGCPSRMTKFWLFVPCAMSPHVKVGLEWDAGIHFMMLAKMLALRTPTALALAKEAQEMEVRFWEGNGIEGG